LFRQDLIQKHKSLHRTAIPLRSIAAGELGRWALLRAGRRSL